MNKRLIWSETEEILLLNFVVREIERGNSITQSCREFAYLYNIKESCVSSKWKYVAKSNRLLVEVAKMTWSNVGKPALEQKLEAQRKQAEQLERDRRERKKYRLLLEQKAKASKNLVSIPTGKSANPVNRGLYVTVSSDGVVEGIRRAVMA